MLGYSEFLDNIVFGNYIEACHWVVKQDAVIVLIWWEQA